MCILFIAQCDNALICLYTVTVLTLFFFHVVVIAINDDASIDNLEHQLKGVHHLNVPPLLLPYQRAQD